MYYQIKYVRMMTKEEYNEIPVHYCKNCGSLAIQYIAREEGGAGTFCKSCGSTETSITNIYTWEAIYGYQKKFSGGK